MLSDASASLLPLTVSAVLFVFVPRVARILTYEQEAQWGKALTSYDLHSSLPEVTRQAGIVQVRHATDRPTVGMGGGPNSAVTAKIASFFHLQGLQNFGLNSILATYMKGLESEGVEWGAELRELRFQAAWRNAQWDQGLLDWYGPGSRGRCASLSVT